MLLLLIGCSEWPTYDYIDAFPDAIDATADHRNDLSITWEKIQESAEDDLSNDSVSTSINYSADHLIMSTQGIEISGTLVGTGWSNEMDTAAEINSFFPYQGGFYNGDIDWLQISPPTAATLCISLVTLTNPGTIIDVMVYPLDSAVQPTEGPYSDFDGVVGGYNQTSFPAEYSVYIGQGRTLGLVVAAEAPNDLSQVIPYKLYISLMPTDNSGARSPCPIPPEDA